MQSVKDRFNSSPMRPRKGNWVPFCRNHPRTIELLKRVSLFKWQNNPSNWKFEALATQMVLIGVLLVILVGKERIANVDPKTSIMVSTVHDDEKVCTNMTCGGLYCLFTQPIGCDVSFMFLKTGETAEVCNSRKGCNWDVEIVTSSNYDDRSSSLCIAPKKCFPQLELLKRRFVDITKYVSQHGELELVEWAITEDTLSASMPSCGNSHPELIDDNDRCGSYNIYMDNTVYTKDAKQKYELDQSVNVFWIENSAFGILGSYAVLTLLYGNMLKARKQADQRYTD